MSVAAAPEHAPAWWRRPRVVSIVVDTPGWFDPYAESLARSLVEDGDYARCLRQAGDAPDGAVAFFLSCTKIVPADVLARNRRNVVVHASALPLGRGFSPMPWQILEGRDVVPLTMIEAREGADEGEILMRDEILFGGSELHEELRDVLGRKVVEMCRAFMAAQAPLTGVAQTGEPSSYPRRRPADSRLDPNQTIASQFNLLRVADNERYPAFFDLRGHRYVLKIERAGAARDD